MERLMLTPEEAAESLGIGRSTMYELLRLRIVRSVKIGRLRRVPMSELRAFAERLAAGEAA